MHLKKKVVGKKKSRNLERKKKTVNAPVNCVQAWAGGKKRV